MFARTVYVPSWSQLSSLIEGAPGFASSTVTTSGEMMRVPFELINSPVYSYVPFGRPEIAIAAFCAPGDCMANGVTLMSSPFSKSRNWAAFSPHQRFIEIV